MSLLDAFQTLGVLLGGNWLLQRLFFASVELAGLALVMAALIRLARIRSPRVVYLLWLVVLVKPIVSLALGSPIAIVHLEVPASQTVAIVDVGPEPTMARMPLDQEDSVPVASAVELADENVLPDTSVEPVLTSSEPGVINEHTARRGIADLSVPRVVIAIWLAGVVLLLAYHLLARFRLQRIIRAARPASGSVASVYRAVISQMGLKRVPGLWLTDSLESPALVGLLRPAILVPAWIAGEMDKSKFDYAMRHELTHWRWFDPAAILICDVAHILFWFHPVVWRSGKRLVEAMELACDQAMLGDASQASDYAEQLFAILQKMRDRRRPVVAGGLFATRTQVGKRIAALLDVSFARLPQLTVSSAVGVVILASVALSLGGAIRSSDASEEQPDQNAPVQTRVLHFPKDRSLGGLKIYTGPITDPDKLPGNHEWDDWDYFGEAQGDVAVPENRIPRLCVSHNALKDLSPLRELAPHDLYNLTITGLPDYPAKPDQTVMPYLSGLTGLKELELQVVCISHRGFQHIKDLRSLRYLDINSDKLLDNGLRYLSKLTSLESLRLSACTDAGMLHLAKLTSLKELALCINRIRGPGLAHLEKLPALRSLALNGNDFSDDGLGHIEHLASLKKLRLWAPMGKTWSITDASLAHLSHLTELEELTLIHMRNITDAGMVHLKALRWLKKLDLRHTQITDAGLVQLKEIKSLESLQLPSRNITDKGLAHLSELDKLKELTVYSKRITDQGVKYLTRLLSLEYLSIGGEQITDAAIDSVAQLTNLTGLHLGSSQLTDKGLAKLAPLKSLETLDVRKARVTVSGLAHLNALLNLRRLTVGDVRPGSTSMDISGLIKLEDFRVYPAQNMQIRDQDLACLANLKHINNLQFAFPSKMAIGDQGLKHLAGLTKLHTLVIGSNVTDDGLRYLKNMKKLSRLTICGDFTDEGLRQLEGLKALGILRIYSVNNFSKAALKRLQESLANLYNLSADSNREMRKKPRRPEIGEKAAPFAVKAVDGKQIRLKDSRGKVVLLYFWATWCKPCVAAAPALKEFHDELSRHDNFVMISLSMDDDDTKVRALAKKHDLSWPQVRIGQKSKVAANYGVEGAPQYILIGKDGKILLSREKNWHKIAATVNKALAKE